MSLLMIKNDASCRNIHIPNEGCIPSARYIAQEIFGDHIYENENVRILPGDVVLDVGANLGLFSMYALSQGAGHVIALEPDPECVVAFLKNTHSYRQAVHLHPFGAWSSRRESHFISYNTRKGSSHVFAPSSDDARARIGDGLRVLTIDCAPIDRLVHPEERIGFIKMDIEGAEMNALKGARDLIKKWKPRMAISVYHKPEDVMEIPAYIRAIVPEYEFVIEESPNGYHEAIAKFWIPEENRKEAIYKRQYGKSPIEQMMGSLLGGNE